MQLRPPPKPLLQVEDLTTLFHTTEGVIHAVNGMTLSVNEGEVVALVGESGSGKSVSMLSVMGLIPNPPGEIASGRVLFQERDLLTMRPRDLRQIRGHDIAMIFQDPLSSLNPVLTIGRQIEEVLSLHLGLSGAEARRRSSELLDRVGIPDPANRLKDYPHHFSGGMRQRVMIAMALACNPKLLIADEPTTALDVTIQAQIVALVKQLQEELGMAVLWITHDLGVVASIADRVAVMYGGRIIEQGSIDAIYHQVRHPYTLGLLNSIPRLDEVIPTTLQEIRGSPPNLLERPTSCSFAPRCQLATEKCWRELPPLEPTDMATHRSACWHWPSLAASGDTLLERRPLIHMAEPEAKQVDPAIALDIQELKVHFPVQRGFFNRTVGHVRAVDGVSLQVRRGETLGLVGESGCGKTTLGRAVLRLYEPTSGQITFEGQPINALDPQALRKLRPRLQMIFQDPQAAMNPSMRVWEIIAEPMEIHQIGSRGQIRARVDELLELVGLNAAFADRHSHEFSGGQRQRIVIARALALNPDFIVCDEAVSSLDVSVQAQIINLLQELQQRLGLTFLFIAHDLAVVRHISQRVAVMYLGKLAEVADRDTLYRNPRHPYTQALLGAVPIPDPIAERQRPRHVLQGDLPSPSRPPAGCRFHTRCPIAQRGLCDIEEPQGRMIEPGHWVACHFA